MSLVEYSNQLRKRGKPDARAFPSVRMQRRKARTSSRTHKFPKLVLATACEPEPQTIHITDNTCTTNQSSRSSWPTAVLCRTHQTSELFTILDTLDIARHDGGNQRGGKGAGYIRSLGGGRTLTSLGRKKVIFRIDGEPAIRALGVAIQHARSEQTVVECPPKHSSPSMGPGENMNKELCGLVRCFRIYLREKAKMEITTESPLLPWLVRHCGWILSRYTVRSDGRTGYSRLKGREYTAGISIFGEAIWYKLPKTADLTKLDDRWRTATWLGKSDRSDEHIIGLETGAVLGTTSSTESRRQALE